MEKQVISDSMLKVLPTKQKEEFVRAWSAEIERWQTGGPWQYVQAAQNESRNMDFKRTFDSSAKQCALHCQGTAFDPNSHFLEVRKYWQETVKLLLHSFWTNPVPRIHSQVKHIDLLATYAGFPLVIDGSRSRKRTAEIAITPPRKKHSQSSSCGTEQGRLELWKIGTTSRKPVCNMEEPL